MNEEEFIENLNTKEKEDIYDLGFKRGREKGKLEQKKEEIAFLNWLVWRYDLITRDNKKAKKVRGLFLHDFFERIKQLQKEIGGKGND